MFDRACFYGLHEFDLAIFLVGLRDSSKMHITSSQKLMALNYGINCPLPYKSLVVCSVDQIPLLFITILSSSQEPFGSSYRSQTILKNSS